VATPTEISDAMTKIKSDFSDQKAFQAQMAQDGMSEAAVETMIKQGMAIDKFLHAKIEDKVTISPDEEAKFYESNKDKMKHPEQVRASHILLRVAKDAPADQKQAVKAKAQELDAQAKKGEDFAQLATKNSQDTGSAARGGDLGWFAKGTMVPQFDAAVWQLKVGEISDVVETDFGYHVIKATDKRPEGFVPIDDVRPRIKDYLSKQKLQAETQKVIDGLRAKAKIQITL
jgi:peptidyl-prolyl cis-trans isomerase C